MGTIHGSVSKSLRCKLAAWLLLNALICSRQSRVTSNSIFRMPRQPRHGIMTSMLDCSQTTSLVTVSGCCNASLRPADPQTNWMSPILAPSQSWKLSEHTPSVYACQRQCHAFILSSMSLSWNHSIWTQSRVAKSLHLHPSRSMGTQNMKSVISVIQHDGRASSTIWLNGLVSMRTNNHGNELRMSRTARIFFASFTQPT